MKYVFFGSIPAATEALKFLVRELAKENISVVTDRSYSTREGMSVFEYSKEAGLDIIELEDIANGAVSYDYGFTFRFNKILSKRVIQKFKTGIINFHGGPLPNYRGSACHIFAILNEERKFGPTFHFIDESIDTGGILERKLFDIQDSDTGYSVYNRTLEAGKELFEKIIGKIRMNEELEVKPQSLNEGVTYKTKDLRSYQFVDLTKVTERELIKRIKAFHHPHKTGVIVNLQGVNVELRLLDD